MIVDSISVEQIIQNLKSVNQEQHKSKILPLDRDQLEFCWIFKNLDFQHWETANRSQILWLYGPPECNIHHVSSYIVNEYSLKTQRTVLYYFCSSITSEKPAVSHFVRALLHQFICSSPTDKQKSIVGDFVRTLLEGIYKEEEAYYTELNLFNGSSEKWLKKILGTRVIKALWAALIAILVDAPGGELLVVIDGLEKIQDEIGFTKDIRAFVELLQQRDLNMKALLTSRLQDDIKEVLNGLPYIEHDKERRGNVHASYHTTNQTNNNK